MRDRVLAEDARAEPASLTKLMTAYVVFSALRDGRLKLTDMVTISEHAWRAEGSRTFVQVGTQIPVDILIKGMIVQSGNDATVALAERVGGTEAAFAQIMNVYARRLGMQASNFVNSDGLPAPDHYTTARDVATLANALIRDFPQYYPLFSLREFVWNNIRQGNRNTLLGKDPSVDGLKTGHTDSAGFCLASSANRNGMRLVSVVMGAPSERTREEASAALLNYGYTFFETVRVKAARETVLKPRVYKSAAEFAAVGVPYDVYATVGRGQAAALHTSARLAAEPLLAPLAAAIAWSEGQPSRGRTSRRSSRPQFIIARAAVPMFFTSTATMLLSNARFRARTILIRGLATSRSVGQADGCAVATAAARRNGSIRLFRTRRGSRPTGRASMRKGGSPVRASGSRSPTRRPCL